MIWEHNTDQLFFTLRTGMLIVLNRRCLWCGAVDASFGVITTEIGPLDRFFYAEDYHQQYLLVPRLLRPQGHGHQLFAGSPSCRHCRRKHGVSPCTLLAGTHGLMQLSRFCSVDFQRPGPTSSFPQAPDCLK